ncbi:DUF4249 domain-containing protein [Candidatus Latescibacterota bacterium]
MKRDQRAKSNTYPGIFTLLAWVLLTVLVSSCSEEVITLDLKGVEPKIVIEGILTDQGEPCTVKISKSGDFYDPGEYPPVTGAKVTLLDSEGNLETLAENAENEPGLYRGESLLGVEGRTYTLIVETGGETFEAVSTLMNAVEIDSLTYYFEDDPDTYIEEYEDMEEGYVFSCHFTYPDIEDNYYRIKLTHNGELLHDIFMVSDWYESGDNVEYDFSAYIFEENDTMNVELLSIDKAAAEYFSTLNAVMLSSNTGPGFSAIPDNPITNISNGALGYFAAYSVRTKTVVFKKDTTD